MAIRRLELAHSAGRRSWAGAQDAIGRRDCRAERSHCSTFGKNERDRLKQSDDNGRGGGDGYNVSPRLKAETGLKNEQRRLCARRLMAQSFQ